MTLEQTRDFFKMVVAMYPRDNAFSAASIETVKAWCMMLEDVSPDAAVAALKAHASSSPFPPSIAEIRQFHAKAAVPMLDADEAYRLAREARRKYGRYQAKEGMLSLPVEVQECIRTLCGNFAAWCDSGAEPDGVERAQFMRIYETQSVRKRQQYALPPGVAEFQKQLTGAFSLPAG